MFEGSTPSSSMTLERSEKLARRPPVLLDSGGLSGLASGTAGAALWFVFPVVDLRAASGRGDTLLKRPSWRRSPGVTDFLRHFGPVGIRAAERVRGEVIPPGLRSSEERFALGDRFVRAPHGTVGGATAIRLASRIYADGYLAARLELSSMLVGAPGVLGDPDARGELVLALLDGALRLATPADGRRRQRATVRLRAVGRPFAGTFAAATQARDAAGGPPPVQPVEPLVFVVPPLADAAPAFEIAFDVLRSRRVSPVRVITLPAHPDSWGERGRRLRTLLTRTHAEAAALRALHGAWEDRDPAAAGAPEGLVRHLRAAADRLKDTWAELARELGPAGGQAWTEDTVITEAQDVERAAREALARSDAEATAAVVQASRAAVAGSTIINQFFAPVEQLAQSNEGSITMSKDGGDNFTFHGPMNVGAVGTNAKGKVDATGQRWTVSSPAEFAALAEEFARLRAEIAAATGADPAERQAAEAAVTKAEAAAKAGDEGGVLAALKSAGGTALKWTLGVAEKIAVGVATKAIQGALGVA